MDGGGTRWKLSLEAIRLWIPIIVSLCAISLTIYQANASRRHNRLAMTPIVDLRLSLDADEGALELAMTNVGIGPAIVKDVRLVDGNIGFDDNGFAACRALDDRLGRTGEAFDTDCFLMDGDYVLRAGDTVTLYATRPDEGAPVVPVVLPADLTLLEAQVKYCSFYEECWNSEDD